MSQELGKCIYMEKVVSQFLKFLKIPISAQYVEQLITGHPEFPSLLSISDVFNRLGINHVVTRIKKEQVHELEFPYLVPLDTGLGNTLLVKNEDDLRKYRTQLDDEWSGVVLLAERTNSISDKENNEMFAREKSINRNIAIIMLALAGLLLMAGFYMTTLENIILALAVAGVIVGYFLCAKELGISYAPVDAFCNVGKDINCDRVLKSDITLLGVNFSDAVLAYFLFQSIIIGMSSIAASQQIALPILSIPGLLALPVVVFSLYYQYAVAKTWCRLCLIVDGLLIIQALVFGYGLYKGTLTISIGLSMLLPMAATALFVLLSVISVKVGMRHYQKLVQLGSDNRIKHNPVVFTTLLRQQKRVDELPFDYEMQVGNPFAPIKIIMVSSLHCNPCKLKHEVVHQLVATYPDLVNVSFRFAKSASWPTSAGTLLSYWFHNIYGKENESTNTATLMHNWFELWDLQKFEKKYGIKTDNTVINKLEQQHNDWTKHASTVPMFLVNGFELPRGYTIDDLLAMAPSLTNDLKKLTIHEMTFQQEEDFRIDN
jgi:Vitamin K epoxide reductase family